MKRLFLILFSFVILSASAQNRSYSKNKFSDWEFGNSYHPNKKRKNILLISEASAYTIALSGLNQLWYADYPRRSFHFINDNQEWLQMDKMGHMSSSYYMGVAGIKAYEWAGFSRKESIWYGGMTGSLFLTVIEVLDGTSKQWGASSGDLIANTMGSAFCVSQALWWNEQRVQLKYSYRPTKWAEKNPEQLGSNHLERALKDYNGQTYWLSFNMYSFLQKDHIPEWLSVSLGYGAHFMSQPYPKEGKPVWRKRQYYLSLDIDLNRIKTNSKFVNSVLHTFGFLKFPMPTLEMRDGKFYFHTLYL